MIPMPRALKRHFRASRRRRKNAIRIASAPAQTRIYAIGDVHGCFDELLDLTQMISADLLSRPVLRTIFVFMGDYVDRGPCSRDVLGLLSDLMHEENTVFLRGNHESIFLDFLKDAQVLGEWRHFGGVETLQSYGVPVGRVRQGFGFEEARFDLLQRMPRRHVDFLLRTRASYQAGDYFFCHAGVDPERPLDRQHHQDLMWVRKKFLAHEGLMSKKIVHGHTAVEHAENHPGRINIDTGAYSSGKLSCAVLEGTDVKFLST
jgi:serine/threonine protein phosphatase 1